MMKLKLILGMIYCLINISEVNATNSAGEYIWGENETITKEKWIFLENQVEAKNYKAALPSLHWLLKQNPDLNVALYIYGSKVLEGNIKLEKNPERKGILQDSALWIYNQRIALFGNEAMVLNKKGKVAFKYLKSKKDSAQIVFDLYEKIYQLNKDEMYIRNASNYFKSAIVLYRQNKIDKKKIITVYSEMTSFLDRKYEGFSSNPKKQKIVEQTSSKLSILLSKNVQLNCDEINSYFEADYTANPSLEKARFVNNLLLKNKCLDYNLFIITNNKLLEAEPSAKRFSVAAKLYLHNNNLTKANECFLKALELETNDSIKSEILLQLAKINANNKDYSGSKTTLLKAIKLNSNNLKAYEFMGDLYLLGANQCKSSNILEQKGVYIAAYKMYRKGNSNSKMISVKKQFPSMEEIFVQNKKEGDTIKLNCWINEEVVLIKK